MDPSPARPNVRRALVAAVLVAGVLVALPAGGGHRTPPGRSSAAYAGALQPFDSCGTVLEYFREQAPDYLLDRLGGGRVGGSAVAVSGAAEAQRDSGAAAGRATVEHSTTNVQEAGVDEPDLVKTDGNRIVAVAQERVHLVSLESGRMTRRATLPDPMVRNVLLAGDRLLVLSSGPAEDMGPGVRWAGPQSVLTLYDIADLGDPQPVAAITIDGDLLDARLGGTQVRVATTFSPEIDIPSPVYTWGGEVSAWSQRQLRAAVARTEVDDWVPSYVLRDGAGVVVGRGSLVDCADLARPAAFSGLDTVAVSVFDLGSTLRSRETVGVITGGQQIYATDTSTYVATTEWNPQDGSSTTTSMHKFVTAPSGVSRYHGSGAVPGTLLNSYAMSEYDGVLRVATTVSQRRGWVDPRSVTEGVVTTLQEQGGALRRLGQVGGLGREDNESIQAVRFLEDRGYVVTFRQTDPLYVLDLRDPAAPAVVGELKIPGYSGYLHPVGQDRLLGVGQSGAGSGNRTGPDSGGAGVQFSLFDTANPASPRRLDTQTYGSGAAGAELDPRAFLYWPPRDLVIAPTTLYGNDRGQGAFSGLVLLRADANRLTEVGRLPGREADGMVRRSVVVGNTVYSLSDQALQAHRLDTPAELDRLVL